MKLAITGIKSLKEETIPIDITKMTVITGPNSSGKTSFTLGLKLLSQYLKKNPITKSIEIFGKELEPMMLNSSLTLTSISNGDDLCYRIYFGKNNLDQVDLIWESNNNKYSMVELNYFHDGVPLLLKSYRKSTHPIDEKLYTIQLLLGNLSKDKFEKICNAVKILIHMRQNRHFKGLEEKYFVNGMIPSIEWDFGQYFSDHKTNSEVDGMEIDLDSLNLIFICGKNFPKNEDLTILLDYIEKNAIRNDLLMNLGLENDKEVINQIQESSLQKDVRDSNAIGGNFTLNMGELGMIKDNIIHNLLNYNKLEETKKYLEIAEGYSEFQTYEYRNLEEEKSLGDIDAKINSEGFLFRFHVIFIEWLESNILEQLHEIKEIIWDTEQFLQQKEYFLSTDNSILFDISKYYYKENKNILKQINTLIQLRPKRFV